MRSLFLIFILSLTTSCVLFAQNAHFITHGIIEYEKSINMHGIMKRTMSDDDESFYSNMYKDYIKSRPQFKKLKSTLSFSGAKTLFTPDPEGQDETAGFVNNPLIKQLNTISIDLAGGISITQKKIYEETFLIKDSIRKINWKITDEFRDIAGFTCRRANAIVLDSFYVVAFYTDEIPVSGGPESFTGLPGMILGVALPHEHITWFATKITEAPVSSNELSPPVKGKPVNDQQLRTTLEAFFKSWGTYAQKILKAFLL